jgi:hypothetical protein
MDTSRPDILVEPSAPTDAALAQARRRPVTTQQARQQARADGLLTPKGFDQGYVVLQPSRWLWRFWLEVDSFNRALQRVEAESLVLLDSRQTDFRPHLDAFLAELETYRATTRRLTHHAHALASRRVKDLEQLTQHTAGAWQDDPPPPAHVATSPDDEPPGSSDPAGGDVPSPGADLTTLFGPSLAEERAAARAEATG